ncbi:MAG: transposase family protein, partial [Planctomycetaceae bacterium]|nr:transposase family protein [Planctomycetaceae bacterium]
MYSPEVIKALQQSDRQFKKFFGVSKTTFFQLLDILRVADTLRHKFGGRPSRIPLENKLLWTLQYWREYRTMEHLAYEYNTVVSHIHGEIVWIENSLIQDGTFCLQGKKVL